MARAAVLQVRVPVHEQTATTTATEQTYRAFITLYFGYFRVHPYMGKDLWCLECRLMCLPKPQAENAIAYHGVTHGVEFSAQEHT